jgi:hypothetical protein
MEISALEIHNGLTNTQQMLIFKAFHMITIQLCTMKAQLSLRMVSRQLFPNKLVFNWLTLHLRVQFR